ncbi:helix-turn-helix domain-containing protein [Afifella pfennigii]|uniref:helix-turn-helix domain-containing protein n=1 Tax=Afifella pfennigii TaxID=209897 RepID=UPI00146F9CE1|nr:helix-turn-helix domain-containing protein [Afifella pfennigii]
MPENKFLSVAVPNWEMVFVKGEQGVQVIARGPESHASEAEIPRNCEFFGIQFNLGAFMPDAALSRMADKAVSLPVERDSRFFLCGQFWEIPSFENSDVFVNRLTSRGLLISDSLVADVIRRSGWAVSDRTVQRRMLRATGLQPGLLRQIERAKRASAHLTSGKSILDVVDAEGFSDQAHLTRSLRRFVGRTPKQILVASGH